MDLRTTMMSEGENKVHNTYRLAELMQNLQVILKMALILNSALSSSSVGSKWGHTWN